MLIFAIGLYATPDALADHENEVHITMAIGSSVPGCEETAEGCFLPSTVTIAAGESVIWENTDGMMHFATSGIAPTPDGVFDSGMLNPGDSWSYTFEEEGTYDYYCMVHAWMVGTVIVGDVDSAAPPTGPLTFYIDKAAYITGDTIYVTGSGASTESIVVITVYDPHGNFVLVTQEHVNPDGSFEAMITTGGAGTLWGQHGFYSLDVSDSSETLFVEFFMSDTPINSHIIENAQGSSTPGCEETNECFLPSTLNVNPGDIVTFANNDSAPHTTISGTSGEGPDGWWDSSLIMPGGSYNVVFEPEDAGYYFPYFCMVHPWMTGTITVGDEPASSPQAEAAEAAAAEAAAAEAEAEAAEAESAARIAEAEAEAAAAEAESAARIAEAEAAARIATAEAAAKAAEEAAEQTIAALSPINEKIEITMDFSNETGNAQTFAFLLQIKDENNVTISLSNVTGILGAGQTLDQVLSYTPTESGTYTIEKYLWSDIANPTSLTDDKETFVIQVN